MNIHIYDTAVILYTYYPSVKNRTRIFYLKTAPINASSTVFRVYDTVNVHVTCCRLGVTRPRIKATLLKSHGSDFSINHLPLEQAS